MFLFIIKSTCSYVKLVRVFLEKFLHAVCECITSVLLHCLSSLGHTGTCAKFLLCFKPLLNHRLFTVLVNLRPWSVLLIFTQKSIESNTHQFPLVSKSDHRHNALHGPKWRSTPQKSYWNILAYTKLSVKIIYKPSVYSQSTWMNLANIVISDMKMTFSSVW